MSEQGYERKKDFVNHALSRCVASMYPNVCRVAYHTRDTDEGLRETAMIYLAGGYSRRVDVTGLDLPATLDAVLAVFREAACDGPLYGPGAPPAGAVPAGHRRLDHRGGPSAVHGHGRIGGGYGDS